MINNLNTRPVPLTDLSALLPTPTNNNKVSQQYRNFDATNAIAEYQLVDECELAKQIVQAVKQEQLTLAAAMLCQLAKESSVFPQSWLLKEAEALVTGDWSLLSEGFAQQEFVGLHGKFLLIAPYKICREAHESIELTAIYGQVLTIPQPPIKQLENLIQEIFGTLRQSIPLILPFNSIATCGNVGGESGEAFIVPDAWYFPSSFRGPALNDMKEQRRRTLTSGQNCANSKQGCSVSPIYNYDLQKKKDNLQMKYKLKINPSTIEKYSDYAAFVIYASGLVNKPSNKFSTEILRAAEREQRKAFGTEKPSSHPHIAAWRKAYKDFGAKPTKYLCSVEALLSRTLKGNDLPNINCLVDIYNAVSIRHLLPVGGEDWDHLSSDLTLTIASGQEPFVTYQSGEEVIEHPEPGEVIWVDSTGVTCRRWNWRQCHRTALTVNTSNAYFVLDCLPPYSMEQLKTAGEELMEHLRNTSPSCTISYGILDQKSMQ